MGYERDGGTKAADVFFENVVFAIHRYCRQTSFGKHEYATFEIEGGEAVVRAVGSATHCTKYLEPGRLLVNVVRYRKRVRVPQYGRA